MSTRDILLAVLERIPVGDSYEYNNVNCHIIKVDEREVDFWIGTITHQIPDKVQKMMEVAEDAGYKVTTTLGTPLEELKRSFKPIQVGLGSYFNEN